MKKINFNDVRADPADIIDEPPPKPETPKQAELVLEANAQILRDQAAARSSIKREEGKVPEPVKMVLKQVGGSIEVAAVLFTRLRRKKALDGFFSRTYISITLLHQSKISIKVAKRFSKLI